MSRSVRRTTARLVLAAGSRRAVLLCLAALIALWMLLPGSPAPAALALQRPHGAPALPDIVAIEVSGASRGSLVLRRFASALLRHAIRPARPSLIFEAFIWLDDAAAEAYLCSLLAADVTKCVTRSGTAWAMKERGESEAIASDHDPLAYGAAWSPQTTPNTLRCHMHAHAPMRPCAHAHVHMTSTWRPMHLLTKLPPHQATSTPSYLHTS